ncbi:MAG: hypothetical protein ACLQJR_25220 [Stellaceae bacterium]
MTTPRSSNRFLTRFCSDVRDVALAAGVELAALKAARMQEGSSRERLQVIEETARMVAQLLEIVSCEMGSSSRRLSGIS